ncbi:YitT family protein [Bacillus sp. DX1.1]|uniref:YitT family protein n=1 Tax=unclassified Bacillus (in: firmicutes) TaxID=185979 RepID=UPI00257024B7|nr:MULTISPECIES: YitT family protein [unclassified Bacillus (in: firmicutes)]MDM5156805.1 YitT family protein [Bacillus sp. DX1.1]WJE81052.1 YitT family protein [Bacillus sp. DX3.1]
MRNIQSRQFIKEIFMVLIGSFILSATLYHIHFQNHLTEGGFVGIALFIQNFFDISPSISTVLMDIPVILLCATFLGKKMVGYSFMGSISFGVFYSLMENYSPFTVDLSNNLFVAAVVGGALAGIGLGFILRFGGATGGDDILTIVLSNKTRFTVGQIFFVFDALVIALSLYYLTWTEIAFTILSIAVQAKALDLIYYPRAEKKTVSIPMSKKHATN